jgi:hypothetical protein
MSSINDFTSKICMPLVLLSLQSPPADAETKQKQTKQENRLAKKESEVVRVYTSSVALHFFALSRSTDNFFLSLEASSKPSETGEQGVVDRPCEEKTRVRARTSMV